MINSENGEVHLVGKKSELQADALAIFIALHKKGWLFDVLHLFNTMLEKDHPLVHTDPVWDEEWRMEDEEDEEDDDEFY